ncbi:MAG: PEP-CTERM sorting domain-containing protein [Phycisphaeraceae bacterium]|nr:PEP-CTERM sorting domain-containing protein [Phycisphaeraceae bacterium]MCW5755007.1 PEP-CTERM sorting domain-containing protein [Phycisphaeraceae bacterium]
MRLSTFVLSGAAGGVAFCAAATTQLTVTSYDMLNGMSGTFSFFDSSYNGSGNPAVALSPLSGGVGELTDGIIATSNWNVTPAPYVGWSNRNEPILFRLAPGSLVEQIIVHYDDSNGNGGVSPPLAFHVDWGSGSMQFDVINPPTSAPTFSVLDLPMPVSGDAITLTPIRRTQWYMLSEVQFFGVPTPGAFALLGIGLAAGARRRR